MKISPAISKNKKCHSHQRLLASKCEWGLPKLCWSGSRYPHGACWGAGRRQEAAIRQALKGARRQDWPRELRGCEGMDPVSPEACIFPYTVLSSLPDAWSPAFSLPAPFVANVYAALLPLPPPCSSSPSYWDAVSWAQSPKHSPQIK